MGVCPSDFVQSWVKLILCQPIRLQYSHVNLAKHWSPDTAVNSFNIVIHFSFEIVLLSLRISSFADHLEDNNEGTHV